MLPLVCVFRSPAAAVGAALVLALGIGLAVAGRTEASAGTIISVPETTISDVGATSTMTLSATVAGADTLTGFDVTLNYDSSIAVPTEIAIDPRWGLAVSDCEPVAGCQDGTIHLAYVNFSGNPCLGGATCLLGTITWLGENTGNASLQLNAFQLSGTENGEVAGTGLNSVGASIGVLSVQAPPSTSTPTNTRTSTPTDTPTSTPLGPGNGGSAAGTPTSSPTTTPTAIPSSTTPVAPSTQTAGDATLPTASTAGGASATSTPVEQVAGEATPGSGVTPVAPGSGTGTQAAGLNANLTIVGLALVMLSLLVLVPSGITTVSRCRMQLAERRIDRYFDELEMVGRSLASPDKRD